LGEKPPIRSLGVPQVEAGRAGHPELTEIVEKKLGAATTEAPVAQRNSEAADPQSKAPAAKLSERLVIPCVKSAAILHYFAIDIKLFRKPDPTNCSSICPSFHSR
jgi:hypothetical protein